MLCESELCQDCGGLCFLLSFRLCVGNRQNRVEEGSGSRQRRRKGMQFARTGREFGDVPVIPTREASRNKEELKVSTTAGESVMMRTGAAG